MPVPTKGWRKRTRGIYAEELAPFVPADDDRAGRIEALARRIAVEEPERQASGDHRPSPQGMRRRRAALALLVRQGTATVGEIAAACDTSGDNTWSFLGRCPWFCRVGRGLWALTDLGRKESSCPGI